MSGHPNAYDALDDALTRARAAAADLTVDPFGDDDAWARLDAAMSEARVAVTALDDLHAARRARTDAILADLADRRTARPAPPAPPARPRRAWDVEVPELWLILSPVAVAVIVLAVLAAGSLR